MDAYLWVVIIRICNQTIPADILFLLPPPSLPPKECEREVLVLVLQNLEHVLQDRTLTLSAMSDLSPLCQLLCRLTSRIPPPATVSSPTPGPASSSSSLQQHLQQPLKMRPQGGVAMSADVSPLVYRVLATLASYPTHLDRKAQVRKRDRYH